MKNILWLLLVVFGATFYAQFERGSIDAAQQVVILSQEEIDAISRRDELYVYFGPEVCSAVSDLPYIHKRIVVHDLPCRYLTEICDRIAQGKTTAQFDLVDAALYEAAEYLSSNRLGIAQEDAAQLFRNLEDYYAKLEAGMVDLVVTRAGEEDGDTTTLRSGGCASFFAACVGTLSTTCLNVKRNATIAGNLTVDGSEIIQGDLTVTGSEVVLGNLITGTELIFGDLTVTGTLHVAISPVFTGSLVITGAPQQGCIIFVDDALVEKARICTSAIPGDKGLYVSVDGGATQNLRVNNEGGTVLAAPTSGAALTVTGNAGASAIIATGTGTAAAPALTLIGNPAANPTDFLLTIDTAGVVRTSTIAVDSFIYSGCEPGPLTIGTSDATSFTLATNACTSRVVIDSNGAVTVIMPTAGEALTVNGNMVLPAANAGGTQGILKLGGTSATRVNVYEFGTRNLFAGSGAVNSSVTGADNISIGTTANSALTTQNNTIAIGNASQATATDSITIGNATNTSAARTIVLGSADSVGGGTAPIASVTNAIAMGSASGANAGAAATGISAIAIGGADGAGFTGAQATGDRSVAIGLDAISSGTLSIALGSASDTAGGTAPIANNTNAIAIGGASGANIGASASGIASISIGGAGPVFAGAKVTSDRSIALGLNATTTVATSIAVGSASGVAGGLAPTPGTANSIAIGSANGAQRGASALGTTALSIGGSDGVFPGAQAGGSRTISIGVDPVAGPSSSILIGSASGVAGGIAPVAVERTAIAIGSARNAQKGADPGNVSSIAIGGSDGTTPGPSAGGVRSIAIGLNANTAGTSNVIATIVLGSASAAGGLGPVGASNNNISIGSANGAQAGANTSGASVIAIGGSDGTFPGASSSSAARCAAIGSGAVSGTAIDNIVLGNASATAVRVGIGIAAPQAKLDIVGVNGTPVLRFNQVNTGIVNAPRWLNPSTSAVAGTPIHYNASVSHQLFGFTSSERYKTNIRPISSESEIIYQLNPVLYDPKEGYGEGSNISGFIAEEVNLIAPNLVIFNEDNQPENVAYNSLHAFAIEELQKHQQQLTLQTSIIDSLLVTIADLQARINQYNS